MLFLRIRNLAQTVAQVRCSKQQHNGFAKNRLHTFYNPELHKPEEAMMAQAHSRDTLPPPPETFGVYSKKPTAVATYDKETKESAIEKTTKNQDVKYKTTRSTKFHHVPRRFLQRGFGG